MAEKNEYYVEGYRFQTIEDADRARLEQKQTAYFEGKLRGRDAANILAVYDKILDEKVFVTPVGWNYVISLQEKLRLLGIREEKIRPLPVYITFQHEENTLDRNPVRDRIKVSRKKKPQERKLFISTLVNVFLGFLVLAMFVITLRGSTPNVINYKIALTNQYAAWEQELTQREKAVKEKEQKLGIDVDKTVTAEE